MKCLILMLLLTTVGHSQETPKPPIPEHKNNDTKTTDTQEQPDEALLLFLAEWSDESDQWLDPQVLDAPEFEQSQTETDDDTDPDRS